MNNQNSSIKGLLLILILVIVGVILVLCFGCCVFSAVLSDVDDKTDNQHEEQIIEEQESQDTDNKGNNTVVETEESSVNYEIKKEAIVRFDYAKSYYVLATDLDITSETIQSDVKEIINRITEEKGKDINIEIFKTEKALNLSYDREVNLKLQSNEDIEYLSTNYIATYSGGLSTMLYEYSIAFFPTAFSDNSTVGDKVDTIEYKP